MVKLSVVIITLNEQKHIEKCLASVQSIADEVVVIDSHSTDATKDICAAYDVRFIEHDWEGYSATKNYGNSMTSHTWVLSLDADESLDDEAIESLKSWKSSNPEMAVYQFKRKNYYGDKWVKYCGWYPDIKPRLFPKDAAHWTGEFVHEQLTFELSTKLLNGNILHRTVSGDNEHAGVVSKYAHLAAKRIKSKGKSISLLKALTSSTAQFLRIFVLKLGFLHGIMGLKIALRSAQSKWLRYVYFKAL